MTSLKTVGRIRMYSAYFNSLRSLSSGPSTAVIDNLQDQVLVEGKGHSRTMILNRPDVLNALTTSMGARLQKLYDSWENNPDIGLVMMKGSGRAFCAGGDIIGLYHMINDGLEMWRRVLDYKLNELYTLSKAGNMIEGMEMEMIERMRGPAFEWAFVPQ